MSNRYPRGSRKSKEKFEAVGERKLAHVHRGGIPSGRAGIPDRFAKLA